jgi:hypothetical protein
MRLTQPGGRVGEKCSVMFPWRVVTVASCADSLDHNENGPGQRFAGTEAVLNACGG